jgi:hypothetical protein
MTMEASLSRPITMPALQRLPWALLAGEALLLVSLLLFDRPLIRGDAVAYFMWTVSLGKDFDMDLANQAEHFGALNTYMAQFNPHTQRYVSVFPWGPGLVLLPAFWAARGLDQLPIMRVNDEWFLSLQAYPFAYSLTAMLEVNALALATLALAYGMARKLNLPPSASAVGALAAVWGTPLYYYASVQPVYSHAAATFAHTLALGLFVWAYTRQETRLWPWLAAGLAFGLAALTRWQLLASWAIFALLLAAQRRWRALAGLGAGGLLLAWHIPFTFNWMFGSPIAVPVDALGSESGFWGWPRYLWPVLFSGDRGLFVWSPIAALGLAGLALIKRPYRGLALAVGLTALAQVFINAGVRDWYGGESFGLRRLTEIYPVVAVGGAALLARAGQLWLSAERRNRLLSAGIFVTTGLSAAYGLVMVVAYLIFLYFTDPAMGYVAAPPPATALNTLAFFLSPPKFDLIWPMMEHHFGPWAWTWPGP